MCYIIDKLMDTKLDNRIIQDYQMIKKWILILIRCKKFLSLLQSEGHIPLNVWVGKPTTPIFFIWLSQFTTSIFQSYKLDTLKKKKTRCYLNLDFQLLVLSQYLLGTIIVDLNQNGETKQKRDPKKQLLIYVRHRCQMLITCYYEYKYNLNNDMENSLSTITDILRIQT